jgi:tryptophan synthase alpha chain
MNRYEAMFARLGKNGAFVPFLVLGDPTPDESLAAALALVRGGADALELGIAFSDPLADGPTIQAADVRALAAGTRPRDAFAIIAKLRAAHADLPIGLLVYASLVEAPGHDAFYQAAQTAGVDSVLVADAPTVEVTPYVEAAERHGICPVLIATPNGADRDVARVAELTRGYTYVVSRAGVTGAEREADADQHALIARLRAFGAAPCLLGFGISKPEHVRAALDAGAAGAICGSATVAIIEKHLDDANVRCQALERFTRGMKAATIRS